MLIPNSDYVEKEIEIYTKNKRNHMNIQAGFENIIFLNRRGAQLTRVMIFTIIKSFIQI